MSLFLKGWKKVSSDKHTTTMQHSNGHKMTILHSALSPKHRGDLAGLDIVAHQDGFSGKKDNNSKQSNPKLEESKKSPLMADGGKVSDAEEYDPYADPVLNPKASPSPSPEPKMADGGKLQDKIPEPNKKAAADFSKGVNQSGWQPEQWAKNIKSAVGMKDGGKVDQGFSKEYFESEAKIAEANNDPKLAAIMRGKPSPEASPKPAPKMAGGGGVEPPFGKEYFDQEAALVSDPKLKEALIYGEHPPAGSAQVEAPSPQSEPAMPQVEAPDPAVSRKREIYNTLAPEPFKINESGNTQRLDPTYWGRAEELFNQEQQGKANEQQQAAQSGLAENQARKAAGLPEVQAPPMPEQPAVGPSASANVQQPSVQPPKGQPSAQNQDPFGTNATMESFQQGLGEAKAGIGAEARAIGQQGAAEALALHDSVQKQQAAQHDYQSNYNRLEEERQNFQQDLKDQHIDPNHYMNSLGTVGKVRTAIGLILGGMGAGVTHQENTALKFLQSQIDRDIHAQAAEMGKKENLLKANMQQFGNLHDAMSMTRMMQNDIVSMQLKEAAAKSMDPLARARALQAAGKLDMDTSSMQGQMAMRRTLLDGANAGHVDPAKIVNLLIPEHQRGEANKELTAAQNMVAGRDNVVSAFDQLAKINTVGNRVLNPIQSKRQIDGILGPIVAQLSKETAGRFTEQDAGMLNGLFPRPGNSDETNRINRARAVQLIQEKMHFPILQTYGISPANWGRYTPSGEGRIKEAPPVLKQK